MNCECALCKNNKPFDFPKEIVEAAVNDDLVLFCGAGISTEGKTVLPDSFYSTIRNEIGLEDNTIPFSNLMQQYCDLPNGRKKLLKKIRERFNYIHSFPELERAATAFHRELAPLYPIRTIITTNWDTYFEDYCGAIPITIPEDFAFWDNSSRCVLKIHGSIQNLSSIIATSTDYEKRFVELQNGIIGATLKSILATKTVVFIGFSFGDEDFAQIINYLRDEMGDIFPHIYIVTLDATLKDRLAYKNATSIVTSGTFFLHRLKLALVDLRIIKDYTHRYLVVAAYDKINESHRKVSEIDLLKYPCTIYTLSYQDGVIHALERFLHNYQTGEYNRPGSYKKNVEEYEKWITNYLTKEDYWNATYFQGYVDGLTLIEACEVGNNILDIFPVLFLPNAKQDLSTYDIFMDELMRLSRGRSKYQRYAKNFVKKWAGPDIVVHHRPY